MGGKDLPVLQFHKLRRGTAERAEFLARFLKLPLRDASTRCRPRSCSNRMRGRKFCNLIARSPNRRPRRSRRRPCAARWKNAVSSAQITIPGPGFRVSMLLGVIVPICILAYLTSGLLPFFRRTHTPEPVQQVFLGFLVFMFGVMPMLSFLSAAAPVAAKSHPDHRLPRGVDDREPRSAYSPAGPGFPQGTFWAWTTAQQAACWRRHARKPSGAADKVRPDRGKSGARPGSLPEVGGDAGPVSEIQRGHRQIEGRLVQLRRRAARTTRCAICTPSCGERWDPAAGDGG